VAIHFLLQIPECRSYFSDKEGALTPGIQGLFGMKDWQIHQEDRSGSRMGSRAKAYILAAGLAALPVECPLTAGENIPQKPFAQAVWVPEPGQFIITPWYEYSEFFHVWRGSHRESIEVNPHHDGHGFDQNDGMIEIDYGVAPKWAADVTFGYTSAASRSFNPRQAVQSTQGLMDTTFGLRYQALQEYEADWPWVPTLTFRAGGIYRGKYDSDFPFAPGNGSVMIEPSFLANKNFGWDGFGAYAHSGFRWVRSGGNDQWFAAVGLFQHIKQFTLNVGFRHFANTGGEDIGGTGTTFTYSRYIREIKEEIQGGVGYTTPKRHNHYQFYMGKVVDGRNTGAALTFGLYADFPIGK
jgi:hypothetical protein